MNLRPFATWFRRAASRYLALALVTAVAGCGYKGSLYLPSSKPGAAKPSPVLMPPSEPDRAVPSDAAPPPK